MSLFVSYNVFDDAIEHLELSIKSIRNVASHVNIVYQEKSNFGENSNINIIDYLNDLKDKKLIDSTFLYNPNLKLPPHINEINKRNIGLSFAQQMKYKFFSTMDSDEVYNPNEYKKCFDKFFSEEKYDVALCQMLTYYKQHDIVIDPPEDYYVSLFYRINNSSNFILGANFKYLIDPTRRIPSNEYLVFNRGEIQLHHLCMLRSNLKKKLFNSTTNFGDKNKILEEFNKWEYPEKIYWLNHKLYKSKKVNDIRNEII